MKYYNIVGDFVVENLNIQQIEKLTGYRSKFKICLGGGVFYKGKLLFWWLYSCDYKQDVVKHCNSLVVEILQRLKRGEKLKIKRGVGDIFPWSVLIFNGKEKLNVAIEETAFLSEHLDLFNVT